MVTRMFKEQIGEMVEVYIDDMVVKSKRGEEHAPNFVEVFKILRQHKLHLNVDKSVFGVGSSKFLGYIITTQEIEVNPDQITTIQPFLQLLKKWKVFSGWKSVTRHSKT